MNRIGEKRLNNFGSEMIIVGYRKYSDIDIYFPEYDWTFKGARYGDFKKGNIKCSYERRYYGVGYIGEGDYKTTENGKHTRIYDTWHGMLKRCYSEKYHKKQPTYKDCSVAEKWHNFQNFAKWYSENFYEIESEKMCLDKDILFKHNKIYSTDTCIFVPQTINLLFTKSDKSRGKYPIEVNPHGDKFRVQCSIINLKTGKSKNEYLGVYETQEKGFEVYKYYKEKNIKEVADYYKELIPEKLYDELYSYEVEITD